MASCRMVRSRPRLETVLPNGVSRSATPSPTADLIAPAAGRPAFPAGQVPDARDFIAGPPARRGRKATGHRTGAARRSGRRCPGRSGPSGRKPRCRAARSSRFPQSRSGHPRARHFVGHSVIARPRPVPPAPRSRPGRGHPDPAVSRASPLPPTSASVRHPWGPCAGPLDRFVEPPPRLILLSLTPVRQGQDEPVHGVALLE